MFSTGGHQMRSKLTLFAVIVAALVAAGAAIADNPSSGPAKTRYSFMGQLTAVPSNGGVSITVEGGNKAALRAMLGAPVTQTFDYGSDTEVPRRSHGIARVE